MKQSTMNTTPAPATPAPGHTLPSVDPIPMRNFAPPYRRRITQPIGLEPSATRQEFKDECDINRILASYQITGAMNHFAKYSPQYGDFSACDYQEAQNLLNRARQMFDALPSQLRKEVSTPEGFLEFVQDPKNAERMAELGLSNKRPPPAAPAPTPPEAPQGSSGGA